MTVTQINTATTWNQLKHGLSEWRRRIRSRDELRGLSDRNLHDIGLTRCEADIESGKPFWLA